MPEAGGSPRAVLVVLGLLTLAALAARLAGLRARLPHQCDPDRYIVAEAAWLDRPKDLDPETFEAYAQTNYPRLLSHVLASSPGRSFAPVLPPQAPLEEHLAAASGPFVRARLLVELLSLIAIPGTYLLARRFLGAWTSLLAAAFVATSLSGLFYSEQARPHAASLGLSLAAMLAIVRLPRAGNLTDHLAAGGLAALALGCLWNGVFVLPALFVAHALARRRNWIGFAVALAVAAAAVPLFYGFLLQGSRRMSGGLNLGLSKILWRDLNGAGFGQILRGFWSFDPVLVAAAGVGAVALAVRFLRRPGPVLSTRELWIAAAYPVSFVLFWGALATVPPRYCLPLLPYLAVLAAFGVESLLPRRAPLLASVALAVAVLALPVFACAHLVAARSREDTYTLAARWIAAHCDPGREVVCIPLLSDLPLFTDRSEIDAIPAAVRTPWQRYQARLAPEPSVPAYRLHTVFSREMLADRRIDPDEVHAVLASERPAYVLAVLHQSSEIAWDSTVDVLRADGDELAARFDPWKPGTEALGDVGFEQGDRALAKVLAAARPGPRLEIYRLRRP
jgi:hypothetical protein